jgi:hypothetical protein
MSAAVSGSGRSNSIVGQFALPAFALLFGLAGPGARAFEGEPSSLSPVASTGADRAEAARLQLEFSGSSLPRYDNTDGSSRSTRVDMTWMPPRRSALGLSLGMMSTERNAFSAGPYTGTTAGVDLGLRWRYSLDSNYRIDVMAWRRLMPPDAATLVDLREPTYGARVEMQLGSTPKSGFVAERGFLGLQLESGARVTLRRSGGKPMIYYRTSF